MTRDKLVFFLKKSDNTTHVHLRYTEFYFSISGSLQKYLNISQNPFKIFIYNIKFYSKK